MRAYFLIAVIAEVTTFIATWFVLRISHRYKIYPVIRDRDVHALPTPRLGGIAMLLGFVAALGAAALFSKFQPVFVDHGQILAIVGAAATITVVGFLDDLYDLDWTLK